VTSARLLSFIGMIAASLGSAATARADELVQVAQQRATGLPGHSVSPLLGYLARPDGPGPFPAAVLLHGCSGFGIHYIAAAARLKSWGYIALALDSLGNENRCEKSGGAAAELVDAYAALSFLAAQSFVDQSRIAAIGYSMGGIAALAAVEQGGFEREARQKFRAAVAYYPACQANAGVMTVPTLILIGDRDDWTPADACRKMAAGESDIGIMRPKDAGKAVTLVVYPGATHAFDFPVPSRRYLGHFMEYDQAAAQDAERRMREFLYDKLNGPIPASATAPGSQPAPSR
jgi:dienelactone hydrolase